VAAALLAAAMTALSACAQDNARGSGLRDLAQERRAMRQAGHAGSPVAEVDALARITRPGAYTYAIEHGGLARQLMVHVPKSYDGSKPVPLLLSFHGGGAHMAWQASDERYGQISASEKEGFVVVFPNGYSRLPGGKLATFNAGGCCGPAKANDVDDVGFARAIVGHVSRQLNIDGQRVFATGFSNGAMLTHRLACEASDLFRAIAPVAGTDNTSGCKPRQPVAVLIIHARNDDHNRYDGGAGEKSVDRRNMAASTSVPETLNRWLSRNACSRTPQRVLERAGASCDRYGGCQGGVSVAICITERGTHSWPGAQQSRSTEPPSQAISANDVMWDFFQGRPIR
jgi:polyhydroxybutyrate depolymerase